MNKLKIVGSILILSGIFIFYSCTKSDKDVTKTDVTKTDDKKTGQKETKDAAEVFYSTKNLEYWQNYPGKSPKGDEMTPVTDTAQVRKIKMSIHEKVYTCEMHPEILQNYMGRCPKCKMDLLTVNDYKKMKSR